MKLNKKIASLAVAGALLLSGLGAVQSAQADGVQIPGTITLVSGNGSSGATLNGSVTDTYFLNSVATSVGAPAGFTAGSTSQIFQGGVLVGNISNLRTSSMAATAGTNGLNGSPAFMDRSIIGTNNFVSNKQLNAPVSSTWLGTLVSGNFEYRYYYHSSTSPINLVNDRYLAITLNYNSVAGTWSLPVAVTPTTTSLTASASGTTVTLAATVAPAAAAGTVQFLEGPGAGVAVGAPVAVVAGVATTTLTGVTNGEKRYQAVFTPSTALFGTSTSAPATVIVGSLTAPIAAGVVTGNITVDIAQGAGGGALTLTASNLTSALTTPVVVGGVLTASGSVSASVNDSRQSDAGAFVLTGQVGDFLATGGRVLSSSYLGWTPAVTGPAVLGGGQGGNVVAGSAVVGGPAGSDGLRIAKVWATGAPSAADPQPTASTATAALQLRAPLNTASGNYSALMTLTLS